MPEGLTVEEVLGRSTAIREMVYPEKRERILWERVLRAVADGHP